MAASKPDPRPDPLPPGPIACLSAQELRERLDEEIGRAGRGGTALSCLLVTIVNLEELAREHGSELSERTLAYAATTLRRQLRRFDRIGRPSASELLVVLPGADGPRGEIVARRVLDRLRAIKVEAEGTRMPLRISVGLATWRKDASAEDLLAETRTAAQRRRGGDSAASLAEAAAHASGSPPALGRPGPS
ncbi:MAG: diguanylate cyclase [Solirubrobacteraceae bacterium]|jgi:diguanylate cyclase (GGDEF)-like protein